MTCQDSFHEVAFNISFWTRNISSARILFWRGVHVCMIIISITQKQFIAKFLNFDFLCCITCRRGYTFFKKVRAQSLFSRISIALRSLNGNYSYILMYSECLNYTESNVYFWHVQKKCVTNRLWYKNHS